MAIMLRFIQQYCQLDKRMSIYSGFPTRKDQTKYNGLLTKIITLLQMHLLDTINGAVSQAKVFTYTKLIVKMRQYEEHKYLPPKFSELFDPLCKIIGLSLSTDLKIKDPIPQIDGTNQNSFEKLQKGKYSSHSLQKYRVKSKMTNHQFQALQSCRNKKGSLVQQRLQRLQNLQQGSLHKRSMMHSSAQLKQKKMNFNCYPRDNKQIRLTEQYEQPLVTAKTYESNKVGNKSTSHSNIITIKTNKNIRYKAFNALQQAQENILKRQIPLRQQMRRKLKTQEHALRQ